MANKVVSSDTVGRSQNIWECRKIRQLWRFVLQQRIVLILRMSAISPTTLLHGKALSIKSTKPDKYTPIIVEKKDDYVLVEYENPILGALRLELEKNGWASEETF
ncbi:hypothetical protein CRYUN_Cryun23aG0149600 [Craigia yunnanensis]